MLRQSNQQRLLQKLSPQQIQLMKLLQIPTANLEERIKEELEENPALEFELESPTDQDSYELGESSAESEEGEQPGEDVELSNDTAEKVDLDDFLRREDDESGGYDYSDDYYGSSDNERQVTPAKVETSFHDYLLDQLGMLELDERNHRIAEQIIGSLDEDGYLNSRRPCLWAKHRYHPRRNRRSYTADTTVRPARYMCMDIAGMPAAATEKDESRKARARCHRDTG